jgi:hypothetical protein
VEIEIKHAPPPPLGASSEIIVGIDAKPAAGAEGKYLDFEFSSYFLLGY